MCICGGGGRGGTDNLLLLLKSTYCTKRMNLQLDERGMAWMNEGHKFGRKRPMVFKGSTEEGRDYNNTTRGYMRGGGERWSRLKPSNVFQFEGLLRFRLFS